MTRSPEHVIGEIFFFFFLHLLTILFIHSGRKLKHIRPFAGEGWRMSGDDNTLTQACPLSLRSVLFFLSLQTM